MISTKTPDQYEAPDIVRANAPAKPLCGSGSEIEGWDGENNEEGEDW